MKTILNFFSGPYFADELIEREKKNGEEEREKGLWDTQLPNVDDNDRIILITVISNHLHCVVSSHKSPKAA